MVMRKVKEEVTAKNLYLSATAAQARTPSKVNTHVKSKPLWSERHLSSGVSFSYPQVLFLYPPECSVVSTSKGMDPLNRVFSCLRKELELPS